MPTSPAHGTFSSDRLVSFSDGIMAFAITLLATNIKFPRIAELKGAESLGGFLRQQWPSYLIFFVSFVIIVMVWANHHNIFRCLKRANHVLVLLNTPILMCVVLVPFAASMLAEYLREAAQEARIAALIYGGLFTVGSIFFNLVWWYGNSHPGLADPQFSTALHQRLTRHFRIGPVVYGTATLLCFVSVWLSIVLYFVGIGRYLVTEMGDAKRG
ncbi:MAG: TMEM175 family protein [Bdellovibrionota bacterium]